MSFFARDRGNPHFVKEDASAYELLAKLRARLETCPKKERAMIERRIRLQEAGIKGEEQIVFELKNSHLPLYALRDLRLEHEGLTAQIDFLVIMPYVNVVIECKNLVGNITVNEQGDFIREFGDGESRRVEGIYSPITQNARHIELIRAIRLSERGSIGRFLSGMFFDDRNKGIVVLANPRTVLEAAAAPEEIRRQIVRGDGLIARLKELNRKAKEAGNGRNTDDEMRLAAERWLEKHVPLDSPDLALSSKSYDDASTEAVPSCPKCGASMVRRRVTRGERKGKEIWGCSCFPKCRGVIDID